MKIIVVGSGRLAKAILSANLSFPSCEVLPWEKEYSFLDERVILLHAGSGRQLRECIEFCERSNSTFIELSTGLETEKMNPDFTLIVCPNTSVLVLKVVNMLKHSGHYFQNNDISITESHQASKTSSPGTAVNFAHSLNVPPEKILSIRDPAEQLNKIGISQKYLDGHAYHKIVIRDGLDEVTVETKVMGHDSYTHGVRRIVEAVINHTFDKKRYSVVDLINDNML